MPSCRARLACRPPAPRPADAARSSAESHRDTCRAHRGPAVHRPRCPRCSPRSSSGHRCAPRVHPPIRQSSRTSDEHSALDPIGKPGRRERDDAKFGRESGCGRLRKPRQSIRFAAYWRADARDALGGVDAADGGGVFRSAASSRPETALRKSCSLHVIALLSFSTRSGVRGPASPSGRLSRRGRRRPSGRAPATPGPSIAERVLDQPPSPGGDVAKQATGPTQPGASGDHHCPTVLASRRGSRHERPAIDQLLAFRRDVEIVQATGDWDAVHASRRTAMFLSLVGSHGDNSRVATYAKCWSAGTTSLGRARLDRAPRDSAS